MILCDSNVWLALTLSEHSHHGVAREWLEQQSEPDSIGFCRTTQQSYLRLLSNSKLLNCYGNEALTNLQAWKAYDALLGDFRIVLLPEPTGLEAWWTRFALRDSASPKLWMDAYLAAFAKAGGFQLVTLDLAFRQFDALDLFLLPA
jgi:toxin-antitoxin system PIN domain toxin